MSSALQKVDTDTGEILYAEERPLVELGTLHATTPAELLTGASAIATPLAQLIRDRGLASKISGREFVRCEGWTTLAAMLGVTPHEVGVEENDGIYTATVELRRLSDGAPVARASAECGAPDETDRHGHPLWAARPRYARRSMALTRATAKACRLAFSWIMVLSGFEATPAEEMDTVAAASAAPSDIVLPGAPAKWDGNGGKRPEDVDTKILIKARDWMETKSDLKFKPVLDKISEVLDERRKAEAEE